MRRPRFRAPVVARTGTVAMVIVMAAATFATTPTAVAAAAGGGSSRPTVRTDRGPVQGRSTAAGTVFLGVPYAAAPVGPQRWRPPRRHAVWTRRLDATTHATPCPQAPFSGSGGATVGSEDCLDLDIYLPPGDGKGRPVLVWFHGGGFVGGNADEIDGSVLAASQRAVVISVNSRLGVLGFLASPALAAERGNGSSGDYGIQDQQAALRWVQRNAAAFGGDRRKVMIFGQSAGGASVCLHLVAPASRGLFSSAIVQSGACIGNTDAVGLRDRATAEAQGQAVADALGCPPPAVERAACLRAQSVDALLQAVTTAKARGAAISWSPHVDGTVLPEQPATAIDNGRVAPVPTIVGWNANEASTSVALAGPPVDASEYATVISMQFPDRAAEILTVYPVSAFATPAAAYAAVLTDRTYACPGLRLAQQLDARHRSYAYEFADPSPPPVLDMPGTDQGAAHATEIQYIFRTGYPNTTHPDPPTFDAAQLALARSMGAAWTRFARSGRPTGAAPASPMARWRTVGADAGRVLQLRPDGSKMLTTVVQQHHCDFWWN